MLFTVKMNFMHFLYYISIVQCVIGGFSFSNLRVYVLVIYVIIIKIYIIQWSLCLARTLLFTHMATDHGFNVGLPDNLGMFNVFSSIYCC